MKNIIYSILLLVVLFCENASAIEFRSVANSQEDYVAIDPVAYPAVDALGNIAFSDALHINFWNEGNVPKVKTIYTANNNLISPPFIYTLSMGLLGRIGFSTINPAQAGDTHTYYSLDPDSGNFVQFGTFNDSVEVASQLFTNKNGVTVWRTTQLVSVNPPNVIDRIYKDGQVFATTEASTVSTFGDPVISDSGKVIFSGVYGTSGGGSWTGIFRGPNATTDMIAGKTSVRGKLSVNESGLIAFIGGYTDTNNVEHHGVFTVSEAGGAITQVLQDSTIESRALSGVISFRGNKILFSSCSDGLCTPNTVSVMDITTGLQTDIISTGQCALGDTIKNIFAGSGALDPQSGLPVFAVQTTSGLAAVMRTLTTNPIYQGVTAAVIASNSQITLGDPVTLNAGASIDANDNDLNYAWEVVQKPSTSQFDFTADTKNKIKNTITLDVAGTYGFKITVKNCGNISDSKIVHVVVSPPASANNPPVPTANPITILSGNTGTSQVGDGDPDVGQNHSYAISTPPAHGTASISSTGLVTYTVNANYVGSDLLTVSVTDDGTPPLTGTVDISISVSSQGGGGGGGDYSGTIGDPATAPSFPEGSMQDADGAPIGDAPKIAPDGTSTSAPCPTQTCAPHPVNLST